MSPKVKRGTVSDFFPASFSDHEKLDGAEDGPGEIASILGVDFLWECNTFRSGLESLDTSSFSSGNGAVIGSFGLISIASADSVSLCFVGLLPLLGQAAERGGSLFFETSFWKS